MVLHYPLPGHETPAANCATSESNSRTSVSTTHLDTLSSPGGLIVSKVLAGDCSFALHLVGPKGRMALERTQMEKGVSETIVDYIEAPWCRIAGVDHSP